jgi:hypothetical protein
MPYTSRGRIFLGTSNLAKQLLFIKIHRSTVFWMAARCVTILTGVVSSSEHRIWRNSYYSSRFIVQPYFGLSRCVTILTGVVSSSEHRIWRNSYYSSRFIVQPYLGLSRCVTILTILAGWLILSWNIDFEPIVYYPSFPPNSAPFLPRRIHLIVIPPRLNPTQYCTLSHWIPFRPPFFYVFPIFGSPPTLLLVKIS